MARLDHLSVPVASYADSKAWYVEIMSLEVEFDAPDQDLVAVKDSSEVAVFLYEGEVPANPQAFMFYFSVDDVHAFHASRVAAGVPFVHEPKAVMWGYGAELLDPTGYRIAVWDEHSMPK
jgi:predicted enzyme related to lactoylglutathione lyase